MKASSYDENLIRVVTSLLSPIRMDTASIGDVQSPRSESEETTLTLDDAHLEDATGKDDENEEHFEDSIVLHTEFPGGDAPSSELGTVDDLVMLAAAEDVYYVQILSSQPRK